MSQDNASNPPDPLLADKLVGLTDSLATMLSQIEGQMHALNVLHAQARQAEAARRAEPAPAGELQFVEPPVRQERTGIPGADQARPDVEGSG